MPGILNHSPADVLSRALIALGLGADPPAETWPVYVSSEPTVPDNVITVYNTAGRDDGRTMYDGERQSRDGIQVRVRASNDRSGYAKAKAVEIALSQSLYQQVVSIDGFTYLIHSASVEADGVLSLGKETPTSKRDLFTVNATLSLRLLE